MNVVQNLRAIQIILLLCATWTLPGTGRAQKYSISDLGSSSWSYSEAHAISGLGHVVGEYEPTNFFYVLAFLYANGQMTDLGNLPGTPYAIAYGINSTNQIAGESDTAINTHAFLWANGAMKDLGTLGGMGGYSSGHAINRAGDVVGEASLADPSVIHAVLYSGSSKTDLGALGGDYSSASAINSSGIIVGESDAVSPDGSVTNVHAFLYTNAPMQDLGTLGGNYSSAKGVNDAGVVVGEAETLIGGVTYLRAFIYQAGTMSGLGTFGGSSSSASAINNAGQVVGYATDVNEVSYAFLYNGTTMINLMDQIPPSSGWTNLASADAINDAGQIAGSGYLSDGSYHGYLLTPVVPLRVAITAPVADASFQAPATFQVAASASDTVGTVTNVEFLVNGGVIGDSSTAPYGATANNLAAGSYTLAAVAADDTGLRATNSVSVTVTNGSLQAVTLVSPVWDGSSFSFAFATQAGFTYDAQYATALASSNSWTVFSSVAGTGSNVQVTNAMPGDLERFYRVIAH